jgi:hypothetical protein
MANIPYWQSNVVFKGKLGDLVALTNQARTPYPSIRWQETNASVYKKDVSWNRPKFAFWNFVHPSNEDIYKYFDKPEKRVWQRKWNREHWGSAYEVTARAYYFTKATNEQKAVARSLPPEEMFGLDTMTHLPQDSTEWIIYAEIHAEDCPTTIWSVIAEQYPDVSATIRQTGDYGYKVKIQSFSNGQASVVAEKDGLPSTHDEQTLFFGECRCVTHTHNSWHWPTECQERVKAEQEKEETQQAVLASMLTEG